MEFGKSSEFPTQGHLMLHFNSVKCVTMLLVFVHAGNASPGSLFLVTTCFSVKCLHFIYCQVIDNYPVSQIDDWMTDADLNRDGVVSYDEFKKSLQKAITSYFNAWTCW